MSKFLSLFLAITVLISFAISSPTSAGELSECGAELPKLTLNTSIENNFDLGKAGEVVLLEGTCSQLKSGACGTGTCEKGWKCMDTGVQCLCSPPQ